MEQVFQIILIMKVNTHIALRIRFSKKVTIIIKVHLDTKDTGMRQNYKSMFGKLQIQRKDLTVP